MPHQRKYAPSHSGGTESQPSRAKRSISACASQGFNSRLSRSTRCAFVSFTASLIGPSRNAKAGGRVRFSARPPAGVFGFVVALPRVTSSEASPGCVSRGFTSHALGSRSAGHQRGHPSSRVRKYTLSIEIVKRSLRRRSEAPLEPPRGPGGRDNVPQPSGRRVRREARHGEERLRRYIRVVDEGSRGLLGRGRGGRSLGPALGPCARRLAQTLLPLVHRRRAEHVLQRARPARGPR